MRKLAMLILVVLAMVLAACSSDGEAKEKEQTTDDTEQASTNDEKQEDASKDELPGQYSVHIDKTTFQFKDEMQSIPFKVAKDGEPLTGEDLGIQVQVPIGKIPFQVTELENGNFEGKVQVPEPGVYQANVFNMADNEMNVIGTFTLTFE